MKFVEKRTKRFSEGPNGYYNGSVDPYLLGEKPVLVWYDEDYCSESEYQLFPAWRGGEKCWMKRHDFSGRNGNVATYSEEVFLTWQEGVDILLDHGAFRHVFAEEKK